MVHLSAEDDGWKELKPQISDSDCGWLHLEASESKNVTVTISMTDTLAPGGCEKFPIHAKKMRETAQLHFMQCENCRIHALFSMMIY